MLLSPLFYVLDLVGVGVFAVSGALAAGRKRLDLFGVYVLAVVTAIGGGTLRDLLLNRRVFWVDDPAYLVVVFAAATATVALARWGTPNPRLLRLADALGLGLFAVSGALAAEGAGVPPLLVVVMGTMSGTFGGLLRDVLTTEIPLILRPGRLYATAAALGPATYLALKAAGLPPRVAVLAGIAATVALRFLAILRHWRLPVFVIDQAPNDEI